MERESERDHCVHFKVGLIYTNQKLNNYFLVKFDLITDPTDNFNLQVRMRFWPELNQIFSFNLGFV